MTATSVIVRLLAETHIHPGIGQTIGAIDLPVSRERTTGYPFIPGSSIKGAFRVWAEERAALADKQINMLFGPKISSSTKAATADSGNSLFAGSLLCSDARLLLLPVRCLSAAFKWVTCPAILKRLERDSLRAGVALPLVDTADREHREGYRGSAGTMDSDLALEERTIRRSGDIGPNTLALLGQFADPGDLGNRLVLLSDDDFHWFAQYALPIAAHNALEDVTKVSKALWYEEALAPDTVMYLLFAERSDDAIAEIAGALTREKKAAYIQIGGNETTGQGWFAMKVIPPTQVTDYQLAAA